MRKNEAVETVQLAGWVKPEVARQLRALAAWRSVTIGALIEEMSAPLLKQIQITEKPAVRSATKEAQPQ